MRHVRFEGNINSVWELIDCIYDPLHTHIAADLTFRQHPILLHLSSYRTANSLSLSLSIYVYMFVFIPHLHKHTYRGI